MGEKRFISYTVSVSTKCLPLFWILDWFGVWVFFSLKWLFRLFSHRSAFFPFAIIPSICISLGMFRFQSICGLFSEMIEIFSTFQDQRYETWIIQLAKFWEREREKKIPKSKYSHTYKLWGRIAIPALFRFYFESLEMIISAYF